MPGYIFIAVILVLVWLLLIRPRRRQLREQQQQLSRVGVGDEILTAGGVYGTVQAIDGDELRVEIAPGVEVRVARRAVAGVVADDSGDEPAELEAAPEPEEEGKANLPEA